MKHLNNKRGMSAEQFLTVHPFVCSNLVLGEGGDDSPRYLQAIIEVLYGKADSSMIDFLLNGTSSQISMSKQAMSSFRKTSRTLAPDKVSALSVRLPLSLI